MQKTPEPTVNEPVPPASRWQRLRAAYRVVNLASHHVLGFTVKFVLLAYFLFAIVFLFLRYAILPNIDYYKGNIEQIASKALGNQVSIARIYASWNGLRPNLFLGDVVLRDQDGREALSLPSLSATVSWWSVLSGGVRFESLEILRPALALRRTADGKLYAAGLYIDPRRGGDGKGADWLLSQREIVIREGSLVWTDELRGAPPLVLDQLDLVLRNQWRHHQFALHATPPAGLAAPLDVRARFSHPTFASRLSDTTQWKGELYLDLRQADLAAWKRYLDYPFELARANGAVRAWLTFDHARLLALTADVGLSQVSARLREDLPVLDLVSVSGRIAAQEDGVRKGTPKAATALPGAALFGARSHTITLTDFTLETEDGLTLPATTLSEKYHAPAKGKPGRTEVRLSLLDLRTVAALAARLPFEPARHALLAQLAPRGLLRDVSAQWQDDLRVYRVKGAFGALGIDPLAEASGADAVARAALPGFDNLSGTLDVSEQGGEIALDAPQLILQLPGYLRQVALPFEQFALKARWRFEAARQLRVELAQFDFKQQGVRGALRGSHVMALDGPLAQRLGSIDLTGTLDNFAINTIDRYLPLQTPHDLRAWLTGALEDGLARDVSVRVRGELAHFPFKGASAAERAGEFRVAGRLENAKLNYAPGHLAADGKAPLWPQAEHIKGSFLFERARMEIRGDTATTAGVALSAVKAVIPDLTTHELLLDIDGNAAGPMQEFLKYVAVSPVLGWISHFTEDTTATGNARLALKLHLPLHHLLDSTVLGALQLQGNDVVLFNDLPPVQGATGKIEFNEKGVNLNGLAGTFVGGPVAISGGSQRDNSIQVKLAGSVTADGLRRQYPAPAMQRLASHFSGAARYTGLVVAREHQVQVTVDSNLAGVALDFPAPLKKAAADSLPLRFVLNGGPANEAGVMRDNIRIALGSGLGAYYERQRHGKDAWRVVHGGIGVNVPAPEPDSGMMLQANLKTLNVDAWTALGAEIAGTGSAVAAAAKADDPDIAQYVVPDILAARADELILGERKLENVVVGATHQGGVWQVNIDSTQANGYVTWSETQSGLGKVSARLSSLIIPASIESEVQQLLQGKSAAQSIPALDIVAERLQIFDRQLGRVEVQAHNVPNGQAGGGAEWRVSKLSISNPDGELKGTGKWVIRNGQSNTSLNFVLDIADAGKMLDRFGFVDTLRRGKGKLSGDIAWKGLPYALDIPSLSGKIQMDVAAGQFLKQDPGAAKLLGVLSLQALPRLLKLDFHDVFSEGLAFDGISATASVMRGVARTDNLKMHGVAATVLMDGTADIANESTNLHVVVIPEFNLGTGPLVYGLAVNPLIGLGGYLAQLFLRAPVMKALTYHMQISGPWKAPSISKIDSNQFDQRGAAVERAQ